MRIYKAKVTVYYYDLHGDEDSPRYDYLKDKILNALYDVGIGAEVKSIKYEDTDL